MDKRYILGFLVLGIVLGASITFLIMNKNDEESDSSIVEDVKNESASIEDEDLSWVDDVHADMLDEWESGDKTFDERLMQKVMLDMTHLKGETHVETGSIEITPKRIDNLLQIVEEEKPMLMYYQTYVEILTRWKKGDFSAIYVDHDLLHTFYDRCRS